MKAAIIGRSFYCIMTIVVAVLLQVQDVRAEEISKNFQNDIIKLLKMTGSENIGLQMGVAISNQFIDSLSKQNPEIPQKAVAAIKEEINLVIKEEMPKLIADTVPVYAKHFTQNEVKALIAFYGTPLGKKSIQSMPAVMNECMLLGQAWGQGLAPKLDQRLESRLKREGCAELYIGTTREK